MVEVKIIKFQKLFKIMTGKCLNLNLQNFHLNKKEFIKKLDHLYNSSFKIKTDLKTLDYRAIQELMYTKNGVIVVLSDFFMKSIKASIRCAFARGTV